MHTYSYGHFYYSLLFTPVSFIHPKVIKRSCWDSLDQYQREVVCDSASEAAAVTTTTKQRTAAMTAPLTTESSAEVIAAATSAKAVTAATAVGASILQDAFSSSWIYAVNHR